MIGNMSVQERLEFAAEAGDRKGVHEALALGADPLASDSLALCLAASNSRVAIVRDLLPMSDAKAMDSRALRMAVKNELTLCSRQLLPYSDIDRVLSDLKSEGDTDAVLLLRSLTKDFRNDSLRMAARVGDTEGVLDALSKGADPGFDNSNPLEWAASKGHCEIVRLLIPLSDPKTSGSCALHAAAGSENVECIRILIPVSEPTALGSRALVRAVRSGHAESVLELIPVSDVCRARATLESSGDEGEHVSFLESMVQKMSLLEKAKERGTSGEVIRRSF